MINCLKNPYTPFIVNTCLTTDLHGIHWIACVLIEKPKPILYIYDSLGKDNLRPNDKLMYKICSDNGIKIYMHDDKSQFDESFSCGWYSIFVCKQMELLPELTIENINNMITKYFGGDNKATKQDEDILKRYFGAYKTKIMPDKDGEGFFDTLGRHFKGVIMSLKGTRNNLAPSIRLLLESIGDLPIEKIMVCRKPLGMTYNTVLKIVQIISFRKPTMINNDKLFHLYLVITVGGKEWILEKNESIQMKRYYQARELEQKIEVPLFSKQFTINKMFSNAVKGVGEVQIYHYAPFSSNCQKFCFDMLSCSYGKESMTEEVTKFIMQDVKSLVPTWAKYFGIALTDTANRMTMALEGYGKRA